jgi:hypothetical protein
MTCKLLAAKFVRTVRCLRRSADPNVAANGRFIAFKMRQLLAVYITFDFNQLFFLARKSNWLLTIALC